MNTLKTVTSVVFIISLLLTPPTSFATNKVAPKTQYTKKTYNKILIKRLSTVQTKEFRVTGPQAWSEAKRNGFDFYPSAVVNGQNLDGVSTYGYSYLSGVSKKEKCILPDTHRSQVIAGNMILLQCKAYLGKVFNSHAYFKLFWNKKLKNGWKIKDMKLGSSAGWTSSKWQVNTNNIATEIKLTNSSGQRNGTTVIIREIILIGPKNGRWQDAFDVM